MENHYLRQFGRIFFAALYFVSCVANSAGTGCDPECDGPTPWNDFTAIKLTMPGAVGKSVTKWSGEFDYANFDMRVDMEFSDQKKRESGTVAVIGGRVLFAKGFESEAPVGDYLDGAVLYMKLATILLGRTVPGGPAAFKEDHRISYREPKIGIRFAIASASGYVTAPWSVDGKLKKLSDGAVQYELHLKGGTQDPLGKKGEDMNIQMLGTFSMLGRLVFPESLSLENWKGPKPYKTVANVRAYIAEEFSPGAPDPTKNFTGFWKEKCEEDFGLQIKPVGSDGKYSVSFCGPGGCFEPGTYRPNTYINLDRSYQVVSEAEIGVGGNGSPYSTYKKCSVDPNPKK